MKVNIKYILLFLLFFSFFHANADEADENKEKASKTTFTVVIDPGHGGRDPGAIGKVSYEKDINLAIAKRLGNLIKTTHKDVRVVYTRETDKKVKLEDRPLIANQAKANLFISIHTNALEDSRMKGTESYTFGIPSGSASISEKRENASAESTVISTNSTTSISPYAQQNNYMATEVQKAFKNGNRISKGTKTARFVVLKYTAMPAILIEVGYITNDGEENYLNSVAGQKAIAKAIHTAFTNYKKRYGKGGTGTQLASTSKDPVKPKNEDKNTTKQEDRKTDNKSQGTKKVESEVTYRVQFLLSDKKLPAKSPKFKGLTPVEYYVDNGNYKYTYGNTTDLNDIIKKRKEVLKSFNDAFIVIFKDGKRIGVYSVE